MLFDNVENILTLFATIIGLFACLFLYIKAPKRGYLYLIAFFLFNFCSNYYWTIYMLVMHDYPDVSEFLAYIGWNIGYLVLFLVVFTMRKEGAKRYFHSLILWPVATNLVQFFLYIQFGGILNNIWQVGLTTLTMVVCMQDLMYYRKNRKAGVRPPYLALLVLTYLILEYAMWTVSCFDRPVGFGDPYHYFAVLTAVAMAVLPLGAEKDYRMAQTDDAGASWDEYRFQALIEAVTSAVIFGACVGGYLLAVRIKETMPAIDAGDAASAKIITTLFAISAALVLIVLFLIVEINLHYRKASERQREMDAGKRSRFNFLFTIAITLVLMVFAVLYNSRILYDASVVEIYEDGKDVVVSTATDLENYLTVAKTTLRVTADTVGMMERNGASSEEMLRYIVEQTTMQAEQFDENFTGLYAYINGEYMDGLNWVPPEGYDPVTRDWYAAVLAGKGEVIIVSPYVDTQTGDVVITVGKSISDENVVCLDVIVNHIQEITEEVGIAGKGYGMVVNSDGFIVAHRDRALNGLDVADVYGADVLERIVRTENGRFDAELDGAKSTLFVHPIMDQWIDVIVVENDELYESVHSQLAISILISLVTFFLIAFFYYFGYRNEQRNSRKVEELNMQVVTALAEAIDAKDEYTNGHSARVAKYTKMVASRAGYSDSRQNEIYMMALLHDVGKIGVPDEVIRKPGKLTAEEYGLIKSHPVIGGRILGSIKERPELATGARWHHERFDGSGYPDGLSGETIPEEARIIAVADAYDAMTSRRSYRDVMPQSKARSEFEEGSGTQFDPRFAKIMIDLIDEDKAFSLRENGGQSE